MIKPDKALLYRSFLVDLLSIKNIGLVNGRRITIQKIKYLEKEYKSIYKTDPKVDFQGKEDKYKLPENSFVNIYKTRIGDIKKKSKANKASQDNHGGYKHKSWRDLRLLVFKRDNNTCENCKSKINLNCHHNYYISGRKIWEYPLSCFSTLCRECHEAFHKKIKGSELVIRNKKLLLSKLEEEKLSGFTIERIEFKKQEAIFLKNSNKPKLKKIKYKRAKVELKNDKPETLQQRRNRLIVPQWKIDEYRKNKNKKYE